MNADVFNAVMPMLFRGLKVTMEIAVIGILLGFILGSLSGYALQSKSKVAKGSQAYMSGLSEVRLS